MARRLYKLLGLSWGERMLLVRALLAVIQVKLHLLALKAPSWRRRLERASAPRAGIVPRFSAERIAWAVSAVSSLVPGGSNCLVRALAARIVLARFGLASELVFGVARDQARGLNAHAWLSRGGRVLIGASTAEYAALEASGPDA